jgi:hypothetical protein
LRQPDRLRGLELCRHSRRGLAEPFTFGAWGGYHDAVDSRFGISGSSGFYGGSLKVYPTPNVALSIGVTSEFSRVAGSDIVEFQPDLFARRNVSFHVNGGLADRSAYGVTAGVRFYFGPARRHTCGLGHERVCLHEMQPLHNCLMERRKIPVRTLSATSRMIPPRNDIPIVDSRR